MDLPNALRSLAYWMALLQAVARAAGAGRAELEAADVEDVEGDVVALAGLAQQIFDGHLAIGEDERAGGGAADAELVLLRADGEAGSAALDEEGGEFFAVDFGEDGEEVGETGVGDPHLLAVQDVVAAVGGENGAGAAIHGVAGGGGFGERVGADPFAGGELGQVLLFLRGRAVPDDGQRADAGVGGEGDGEAGQLADGFGDDGGGDLIHSEAAVGFGNIHGHEAEIAGLAQQGAGDGEVLGFDFRPPRAGPRWR